jgi:hypothetical protein
MPAAGRRSLAAHGCRTALLAPEPFGLQSQLWYCDDPARRRRRFHSPAHAWKCLLRSRICEVGLDEIALLMIDKAEPGWQSQGT